MISYFFSFIVYHFLKLNNLNNVVTLYVMILANIFIDVKAKREASKAANVWALTHVIHPEDSITMIALLAHNNCGIH